MSEPRGHVALAIDAASTREAAPLVELLAPHVGVLKVGLELFTREGPSSVTWARGLGLDVFLDLKLHDIPETVDRAVAAVCGLGARYLTIHAQGGAAMIERAATRAAREGGGLTVLAVTVLTSLDDADLRAQGIDATAADHAVRLARMALSAGAGGFVCSAGEVGRMREAVGRGPVLVTPGIRLADDAAGDQKRVASPADAIAAGSDLLVIGRPLRDAADPVAAARAFGAAVAQGLAARA